MSRFGGLCCGPDYEGVIPFVPGSEIVQEFLIVAASTIVDISSGTVTAQVVQNGAALVELAVGSGIELENTSPAPADDQQPHGVVRLTEDLTASIPEGALLRVIYTQDDVTMPALGWLLKRVA